MSDFPRLARSDTGETFALPRHDGALLIGRSEEADVRIPDKACSRRQAAVRRRGADVYLEPLSATVPTVLDGQVVEAETALLHGARFAFGRYEFQFLAHAEAAAPGATYVADEGQDAVATLAGMDETDPAITLESRIVKVEGGGTIGRGREATYRVDHPRISRRHAELRVQGGQLAIRDLGSTNGTFVNGRAVPRLTFLKRGDRVDVGPFSLRYEGDRFVQTTRQGNVQIVASHLSRTVADRSGKGRVAILRDVSLVVPPRTFVALIGPSGSGKSTLMNALSAREPATEGRVALNGVDLYASFEALKEGMALVPQDEILHDTLRVADAVRYTARLRLPPDTDAAGIDDAVRKSLQKVDLVERALAEVRNLSGGQRKRACLANETVNEPDLLFVDEVTSGLDEQTDWEIMRLLRRTADRGRTIVCVTHTLANVEEFCHRIVVMACPGVLAFYGTPAECLAYFGVERLSHVYRKLAEHPGETWQERYRASHEHGRYADPPTVADVAPPPPPPRPSVARGLRRALPEVQRQLLVLTQRANRILLHDKRTLAIAGAQSVTIGLVLCLVFQGILDVDRIDGELYLPAGEGVDLLRRQTSLLFMMGVSCLWFGCSNASKEIVKERPIYRRERDVNLSVASYVLSKLCGLSCLGLAQALALFAIVALLVTVPGPNGAQLLMMAAAVVTGTALGLLISASTRTQDQATTLVPIVLIPQIVMSGVVVPELPAAADLVARALVSGYWVVEGMTASEATVAGERLLVDYPGLFDAARACLVLAFHFVAYLGGALAVLHFRDRRRGGPRPLRA